MMESHCEILWDDNSGAGLERHPTADYGAELDNVENHSIIAQQRLTYKMQGIWINNYLDLFQTKISPTLSLSGMYQKPFIYRINRTNSQ